MRTTIHIGLASVLLIFAGCSGRIVPAQDARNSSSTGSYDSVAAMSDSGIQHNYFLFNQREPSQSNFFIILGVSQERSPAEALALRIGGRVIDTDRYLNLPDHFYAAAIGPFDSRESADREFRNLITYKEYRAAYVQDAGDFIPLQYSKADVVMDYYLSLEYGNTKETLLYIDPDRKAEAMHDPGVLKKYYGETDEPITLIDVKEANDNDTFYVSYLTHKKTAPEYRSVKAHVEQIGGIWYIDTITPVAR